MKIISNALARCFRSRSQDGFSLIELAIVLTIIGIIAVPALQQYQVYQSQKQLDVTDINLSRINTEIGEFYAREGRYPCPSDRSIAFGQPGYGVEVCAVGVPPAPGAPRPVTPPPITENTCTANGGFCRMDRDPAASPRQPNTEVYIGGIPYATIGMSFDETLDGYKSAMTYAVSANKTSEATFDPAVPGAVEVQRILNDGTTQTLAAHGVIVSFGEDREGAFNLNGQRPIQCPTGPAVEVDSENCDNDVFFVESEIRSYVAGPDQYDDRISYNAWSSDSVWAYTDRGDGSVYSTNIGPMGINTETPDPSVSLDVNGDILATQVAGQRICQAGTTNCFQPNIIAGSGIQCPSGQYLVGIANSAPICRAITLNVTPGTCPAGQVLVGITAAGIIQCAIR